MDCDKKGFFDIDDGSVYVVAEIGMTHDGSFGLAVKLTEAAIDSGAHVIKYQWHIAEAETTRAAPTPPYFTNENRFDYFNRTQFSVDQFRSLADLCRENNVIPCVSVFSIESVHCAQEAGFDIIKIPSGEVTNIPMLRVVRETGLPVILSSGMSNWDELDQAVDTLGNKKNLCILQCTSMYPIADSDTNLLVMDSIKSKTGLSVGYSDHTIGTTALATAAAMGASVLEFHFTDSREGKVFRDHQVSITVDEVLALKADISQICILRGSKIKSPQSIELENKHEISFRRGVYPKRSIHKGEIIKREDLILLRPAHGTDAREIDTVIGSKAVQELKAYAAIKHKVDFL